MKSKNTFSVSSQGLSPIRKFELRSQLTQAEAIAGHARDIAVRQRFGISTKIQRVLVRAKTTTEEYLENGNKYQATADMAHSMAHEVIAQGPITKVEQRSVTFLIKSAGELQKYADYSKARYEAAKNGNNSTIIEVIDG